MGLLVVALAAAICSVAAAAPMGPSVAQLRGDPQGSVPMLRKLLDQAWADYSARMAAEGIDLHEENLRVARNMLAVDVGASSTNSTRHHCVHDTKPHPSPVSIPARAHEKRQSRSFQPRDAVPS